MKVDPVMAISTFDAAKLKFTWLSAIAVRRTFVHSIDMDIVFPQSNHISKVQTKTLEHI